MMIVSQASFTSTNDWLYDCFCWFNVVQQFQTDGNTHSGQNESGPMYTKYAVLIYYALLNQDHMVSSDST